MKKWWTCKKHDRGGYGDGCPQCKEEDRNQLNQYIKQLKWPQSRGTQKCCGATMNNNKNAGIMRHPLDAVVGWILRIRKGEYDELYL